MALIAALAGRRVDAPDAKVQRFPIARIATVRDALRRRLRDDGVRLLLCAGACGADLLALEAAAGLAIRRRIVLPFAVATFRERSVVDRGLAYPWGDLYDRFVDEARESGDLRVLDLDPQSPGVYERTNRIILDEASAASRDRQPVEALLVRDHGPFSSQDYTEDFAREARRRGIAVATIPILNGEQPSAD